MSIEEYKDYIEELVNWCWLNLEFDNCPDNWQDTFIIDIIKGYQGNCHTHEGKAYSYQDIRDMIKSGYSKGVITNEF